MRIAAHISKKAHALLCDKIKVRRPTAAQKAKNVQRGRNLRWSNANKRNY